MDGRRIAGHAHGWLRTWFARIWKVRGGGLYACGYAVTFAVLETRSIISGFVSSDSIVDFVTSEALEFVFRFLGDSIVNMVKAFLWPVELLAFRPPAGLIALVAAFGLFDLVLRKPIERWLSEGDEERAA